MCKPGYVDHTVMIRHYVMSSWCAGNWSIWWGLWNLEAKELAFTSLACPQMSNFEVLNSAFMIVQRNLWQIRLRSNHIGSTMADKLCKQNVWVSLMSLPSVSVCKLPLDLLCACAVSCAQRNKGRMAFLEWPRPDIYCPGKFCLLWLSHRLSLPACN